MKEKDIDIAEDEEEAQNDNILFYEDEEKLKTKEVDEEDKDKGRLINVLDRIKKRLDQKDKKKIVDVYLTTEDLEKQLMDNKEKDILF